MSNRLGVILHENEEPYAVLRADRLAYAPRLLFGLLWTLTPFFFLFPLLRLNGLGVACIVLLALSGVFSLLNTRASWYGSALVLTNHRCIDVTRRGLGPPVVTVAAWSNIAAIKIVPGRIWHRLCGLGAVRIDLSTPSLLSFVHAGVRNPELVRNLVCEVQSVGKKKRV